MEKFLEISITGKSEYSRERQYYHKDMEDFREYVGAFIELTESGDLKYWEKELKRILKKFHKKGEYVFYDIICFTVYDENYEEVDFESIVVK